MVYKAIINNKVTNVTEETYNKLVKNNKQYLYGPVRCLNKEVLAIYWTYLPRPMESFKNDNGKLTYSVHLSSRVPNVTYAHWDLDCEIRELVKKPFNSQRIKKIEKLFKKILLL